MSKKELTKKRICFVLYGYKIDVLTLFDKLLPFYEEKNYPLKSIDFDFFKGKGYKSESLPLEKFLEKREADISYNISSNYRFVHMFTAQRRREPLTWYYSFDYNDSVANIMFDAIYEREHIFSFFKEILSLLLKDNKASLGYLFEQERSTTYLLGDTWAEHQMPIYKENAEVWRRFRLSDEFPHIENKYRHIYLQNILSTYHVEEMFDGIPFIQWVEKNAYGTVEKIGKENWLWCIPEEKQHEIQVIFYDKGLLIGVDR